MTMIPSRQPKGLATGGQFATSSHAEPSVSLRAPAVDPHFVQDRLNDMQASIDFSPEELEQIAASLNGTRNFSDANIRETADRIHFDAQGYSMADAKAAGEGILSLRLAGRDDQADAIVRAIAGKGTDSGPARTGSRVENVPDGITEPVPSDDPRVRAGEVFDRIVHPEDGEFYRRRPGVFPNEPYAMRFQTSRELDEEETAQMAGLIGYSYRAHVRGEPMGTPVRDSPYSFIVYADTTKSASDDLGIALESFEESLPQMLLHGSPVRKSDRAGRGTAGTRLVEGLNDEDLKFELYYSDVTE